MRQGPAIPTCGNSADRRQALPVVRGGSTCCSDARGARHAGGAGARAGPVRAGAHYAAGSSGAAGGDASGTLRTDSGPGTGAAGAAAGGKSAGHGALLCCRDAGFGSRAGGRAGHGGAHGAAEPLVRAGDGSEPCRCGGPAFCRRDSGAGRSSVGFGQVTRCRQWTGFRTARDRVARGRGTKPTRELDTASAAGAERRHSVPG